MDKPICFFSSADLREFEEWIELNVENITWEGRYLQEFESFWSIFFEEDNHLQIYMDKINFAVEYVKVGPLVSWFNWIESKLICYCFIYKDISIYQLSRESGIEINDICTMLRSFFVDRYSFVEHETNEFFAVSNAASDNIYLSFNDYKKFLPAGEKIKGSLDTETLKRLEITLYDEWKKLFEYMSNNRDASSLDHQKIKDSATAKKQLVFVREFFTLLFVGALLIFALRAANQWYENYLVKQITLFDSNFFWLDKTLTFEENEENTVAEVDVGYKDLEQLEKLESQNVFGDENVEYRRYETESEVTVASLDSVPKNFNTASLESSDYEEKRKGGYRDTRFGRRKAYRIMINTVHPASVKAQIVSLIEKFDATAASTVKPGTEIPGGSYFNLFIPRKHLGEVLSKISFIEESTVLESNTRFGAPAGQNKVFIWIKSI